MATATLSAQDQLAAQLGLSLSTPAARDLYLESVHDKWRQAGYLNPNDVEDKKIHKLAELANFPKLKDIHAERAMALILENQNKFQKQKERNVRAPVKTAANGKQYVDFSLSAETTTADEALPTRQVLPIIRRVYALVMSLDISVTQPMAGPTSYAFWLDFLRETDSSNLLSLEYNWMLTAELGVPPRGKLRLNSRQLNAVKNLLGITWSLEAEEDAQAILGLNIESELMGAFMEEFVRDIFARHLFNIATAAQSGVAVGQGLPSPFNAANPMTLIPARGGTSITDYKSVIFNALIDADVNFVRANKRPSSAIICGYTMAGFLRKMLTATGSEQPNNDMLSSVGVSNYGNYAARWNIWGTEFLPDNMAFLYIANPEPLRAGHIYAPYVPVMATPRIYGDYDTSTGAYQNKDAWTRNIRERSADLVTKPYAFMPVTGPAGMAF